MKIACAWSNHSVIQTASTDWQCLEGFDRFQESIGLERRTDRRLGYVLAQALPRKHSIIHGQWRGIPVFEHE
jgi:hypothetical protein